MAKICNFLLRVRGCLWWADGLCGLGCSDGHGLWAARPTTYRPPRAHAVVVSHYLSSTWSTRLSPIISLSPLPLPSLSSTRRRRPISGEIPSPAGSHGFHLQRRRDRPLLRLPRRRRRPRLLLHGGGVRDGQERGGGGVDGGDAAGAGDEVHRARRHGRGARDLRPHHRRHHLHRDQPQGQALLPLRRLRAPLLRPRLRPRGARRRHGHRHRRRRRRQGQRAAAQAVRRNDPHPYLCRSPCPVRPHRRHHPLLACRPIPRRLETNRLQARSIRSIIVFCLKGFISS